MALGVFGLAAVVILVMVTALWLLSLALRDSSIVDAFWGTGFVLTTWLAVLAVAPEIHLRHWLLASLVTVWGLRLSLHILARNWGRGEDFRYRRWREQAGPSWWWRSYFKVFLLQGVVMWIVAAPILAAVDRAIQPAVGWLDLLGVAVWAVGVSFESVGDWQLVRFKKDPANRGRLLTSGLWRYTRHPNYFGDAAAWWGLFVVDAAAGAWWTIVSPVVMTFMLLRVSGVTMLEAAMCETKPGYRDYVERTSAFVPWFPRRGVKSRC